MTLPLTALMVDPIDPVESMTIPIFAFPLLVAVIKKNASFRSSDFFNIKSRFAIEFS